MTGPGIFEVPELNLQDVESVRVLVKTLLSKRRRLHGLANETDIMASPCGGTSAGFEHKFGVNHQDYFRSPSSLLDVLEVTVCGVRTVQASTGEVTDRTIRRSGLTAFSFVSSNIRDNFCGNYMILPLLLQ